MIIAQGGGTVPPPGQLPAADGPGAPESWQGARRLHPAFQVNLATGNVYFQFVTSGWRFAGLTPNPGVTLCFNSQGVSKPGDYTAGFDLGPGWSTSLGSRLEFPETDVALLTQGDGLEVELNWSGSTWEPANGYFLSLEPVGSGWLVRDPRQWEYHYDASGAHTKVVSDTGNAYAIHYQNGRASSVVDPSGREASFAYGANDKLGTMTSSFGSAWTFSYDVSGRLDRIDDPVHGSIGLTYDASGRIETVSDLDDHVWQFDYVESGTWEGRIEAITDPLGHVESYAYATWPGMAGSPPTIRTRVTDTLGKVWLYFHDREASPALVRFKTPLGKVWKWTWNDQRCMTDWTDPLDRSWSATYDDFGRMLTITDPVGHGCEYTYDALGNVETATRADRVTIYCYEDSLHPTLVTTILEPEDDQGQRATTTLTYYDSDDGPVPGRWNGLLESVTDAEGVETRFVYDDYGIQKTVYEGPEGAAGGVEVHYDQASWPVFVDLGGMEYPAHFPELPPIPSGIEGRMVQRIEEPYDFHWRGFLRGKEIDLDAPINSGSGHETSSLDYALSTDHRGRTVGLDVETDEIHEHVSSPPSTAPVRSFSMTFDDAASDGRIEGTTPDGDTLTWLRDDAGRVTSFTAENGSGGELSVAVDYYDDGAVELLTRSDGTSSQLTYTDNGMLDTVVHRYGSITLLSIDYDYDARDLPESVTESGPGGTVLKTFDHDSRGRLTRETRTPQPSGVAQEIQYFYDQVGNRTGHEIHEDDVPVETATYHYDHEDVSTYESKNNRLTWVETFDGGGSPLSTTWLFYDDPFGHVSRIVERAAGSSDYTATAYVYDEAGMPWLSWDETWSNGGSGISDHVRGDVLETRQDSWRQRLWRRRDGQTLEPLPGAEWVTCSGLAGASFSVDPVDGAIAGLQLDLFGLGRFEEAGSETYASDALGTVRVRTTGTSITDQELTAFGEVFDADPGSEVGFAGMFGVRQALDGAPLSARGAVMMGYRHYAPDLGRFLMRDPIGINGGVNVYAFVGNAPTAFVDPMGLSPHGGVYKRNSPDEDPPRWGYAIDPYDPAPFFPPTRWEPTGPTPPQRPKPPRKPYGGPTDTVPPPGSQPAPGELKPSMPEVDWGKVFKDPWWWGTGEERPYYEGPTDLFPPPGPVPAPGELGPSMPPPIL